MVSLRVA